MKPKYNAKLTEDQVRFVREKLEFSNQRLAIKFGVNKSAIGAIRRGERYKMYL